MFRRSVKKIIFLCLHPIIFIKWKIDLFTLPLERAHWKLYLNIHRHYFLRLKCFPNLRKCNDFNDKVQWLKLFDQDESHVGICDKIEFKKYIFSRLGEGYTPKTLMILDDAVGIPSDHDLPTNFVIKTNHDSGGIYISKNDNYSEIKIKVQSAKARLANPYGVEGGEWCYPLIKARVFVEEYLDFSGSTPPDYKFHCADGNVLWLQYIYDRGDDTKEIIVTPEGSETDIWQDRKMLHASGFKKPENWAELLRIASILSVGFKYIRIDLYSLQGKIYVGEFTFHPLGGFYSGAGQAQLSNHLEFDRTTTKPPVLSKRLSNDD